MMNYWSRIKSDLPLLNCFRETLNASIFGIFNGSFYPFLGVFLVHKGGSALQIGLLGCAPFVGNLAAPLWARFAARRKVVPLICLIHVAARALILPVGFLDSTWLITILLLLHYIIASSGGPAYYKLLQRIYPTSIRGRVMSTVRFVQGGITALVMIAAGNFLDDYAGWMFLIAGLLGMFALYPFSLIEESDNPDDAGPALPVRRSFIQSLKSTLSSTQGFPLYLIGFFLFELGNFLPVSVYPIFQVHHLHLASEQVALLGTLWTAAWCVTYPFWGVMTDKIGPAIVLIIGLALQMLGPLAYATTGSVLLLEMTQLMTGMGAAAIDVAWINTLIRLGERKVTETSSVHLQFSGMRGASIPIIGSLLFPYIGGTAIFVTAASMIAISLVPMLMLVNQLSREDKEVAAGSRALKL